MYAHSVGCVVGSVRVPFASKTVGRHLAARRNRSRPFGSTSCEVPGRAERARAANLLLSVANFLDAGYIVHPTFGEAGEAFPIADISLTFG